MANVTPIFLVDGSTGEAVPADLRDAIENAQLLDWQTLWQPALAAIIRELAAAGEPTSNWPQSWRWNWRNKMDAVEGLLAYQGFSVVAQGVTQGLARVDLTPEAREPSQAKKPLVYIDYLEVAPWNRAHLGKPPRLRGTGSALLTAAITLSEELGFKGRIGLHSLPQSDEFYRKLGMVDLGPDAKSYDLRYFEMTAAGAKAFLE